MSTLPYSPACYPEFAEALKGKETRSERYEALVDYFDVRGVLDELKTQMKARRDS